MFRLWGKCFKDNRMINDYVYECDDASLNRTKMVFNGLEDICKYFDVSVPMWLDCNINDFKRLSKTRFYSDNFVEQVEFDYLEIYVIEEM